MALFAWGSNKFGEISDVNESCYWSPQGVNVPDGQLPISISAGEGHSIFATESGDVYTFGRGREGQLGLGHEKRNINAPSLVRELQHESIIKVVAGAISSYAITATGRIYHWYYYSHIRP
jgi:alpha-tubulin suppressor-like RCC1 family protein